MNTGDLARPRRMDTKQFNSLSIVLQYMRTDGGSVDFEYAQDETYLTAKLEGYTYKLLPTDVLVYIHDTPSTGLLLSSYLTSTVDAKSALDDAADALRKGTAADIVDEVANAIVSIMSDLENTYVTKKD